MNKERDWQTLSLFGILSLLTLLFVLGSRAVLFAPSSEQTRQQRAAKVRQLQPPPDVNGDSVRAQAAP